MSQYHDQNKKLSRLDFSPPRADPKPRHSCHQPKSLEILSFETELLDLLQSANSLNHNQKKAIESLLHSAFDLFLSPIASEQGDSTALIDLASLKLFKKIQSIVTSLSSLIITISDQSNVPEDSPVFGTPDIPLSKTPTITDEGLDTLSPLDIYSRRRPSSSSYLGSPLKNKINVKVNLDKYGRSNSMENSGFKETFDEDSEFSDEDQSFKITRNKSLTRKSLLKDYSNNELIRTSPFMAQKYKMNHNQIESSPMAQQHKFSASTSMISRFKNSPNDHQYTSTPINNNSTNNIYDNELSPNVWKSKTRSMIYDNEYVPQISRSNSTRKIANSQQRMSFPGFAYNRFEPENDHSKPYNDPEEGFIDMNKQFDYSKNYNGYPNGNQGSGTPTNGNHGYHNQSFTNSNGNYSLQIVHHKQQLKKLEALEKMKHRTSSRNYSRFDESGSPQINASNFNNFEEFADFFHDTNGDEYRQDEREAPDRSYSKRSSTRF